MHHAVCHTPASSSFPPTARFTAVFSDGELAARLSQPKMRAALADIKRDPEAGMRKWESDAEVMAVLDQLQAKLRRIQQTKTMDV